ncbi:hypothetical protein ABH935_008583 [Catenulispora sp. GAS73]|uniref:hypothetical protein n=1 Tax=Catenulispora sp. GAS73 TaxID=3156269 RepID=UPI0035171E5F
MDVLFATEELATVLVKRAMRIARFGPEAAAYLDLRMQQLWGVPSLEQMRQLPGRCRELEGDPDWRLAVDARKHQLVFRPALDAVPHVGGKLVWDAVDRIMITDIVDDHRSPRSST